ncbi:MAG: hypothetical protein CGW95_02950 [Phenylobacterium zucineum]|nr:MAG: hypothetical protein CGW95_02950 [Phenylobacterium zucineum]
MNREQFIRALRSYCKANGLEPPRFDPRHGKGGHGRIVIGDKFSTIPSGELKTGTLDAILKQLGLPKSAV